MVAALCMGHCGDQSGGTGIRVESESAKERLQLEGRGGQRCDDKEAPNSQMWLPDGLGERGPRRWKGE